MREKRSRPLVCPIHYFGILWEVQWDIRVADAFSVCYKHVLWLNISAQDSQRVYVL